MPSSPIVAVRGPCITFQANPLLSSPSNALFYEPDGLIIIKDGLITHFGSYAELSSELPEHIIPHHYKNSLISAGFIDAHVHYPQLPIIASYGEQLLSWLDSYVFPIERQFSDKAFATSIAQQFLAELICNGTTTAAVYCTVHPQSADAFFEESHRLNMRMIAGKLLMNRNAPPYLCDHVQQGYDESLSLIQKWHGRGRQLYAVTPRFAITSTPEQLEMAGSLLSTDPTLYLQTHLAENQTEIETVHTLFPQARSYLDVYDRAHLVGTRSIFGHAIHLHEEDWQVCHDKGCTLAHCPTSNIFLGSGRFKLFEAFNPDRPVHVALGTDIGAGTSLSLLHTAASAYGVAQSFGHALHPVQALWLATAGAAQSLGLEDKIGTISPGMEADLCVINPQATPIMAQRIHRADSIEDVLFALITLGDSSCIEATYIAGQRVYQAN